MSAFSALSREAPFRSFFRGLASVAYKMTPAAFGWAASLDAVPYTHYAVGLQRAAEFADLFGIKSIWAIELGVAGGNGLIWLTRHAQSVSKATGINIHVAGFDNATGLPPISDWRDTPWLFNPGEYPCEVEALRKRLGSTDLILGDVADTLPKWLGEKHDPLGFVSIDVDYYTGTIAALMALGAAPYQSLSPISTFYFDDILGRGMPRFAGEYAAINEFNELNLPRQFDRDDNLGEWRAYSERLWLKRMFAFYCLDHPMMKTHRTRESRRLDLRVD
jgi:hypothetical protein